MFDETEVAAFADKADRLARIVDALSQTLSRNRNLISIWPKRRPMK